MTLVRALLVSCALISASCDEGRTAPPPSASPSEPTEVRPETPPIVVGWSALRISLPIFVADRDGLFEEHGVRVELRRYETAQPLVEELVDGRIDAGGYAALPIVLTVAARAEQRVRVATALVEDEAHPISYLLRRRELPLGSIAELRGRRAHRAARNCIAQRGGGAAARCRARRPDRREPTRKGPARGPPDQLPRQDLGS